MSLLSRLHTQFDAALASGHLVFTPSTCVLVNGRHIKFQIRFAPSLAKKPTGGLQPQKKEITPFNPFLSPEPQLLVESDLSPTHNILLNKFSVVKGHTIITTKKWESQSSLLKAADFKAAWILFGSGNEGEFLGFYNCGPLSGASVPHKHMQFIPVKRGSLEDGIPIDQLMEDAQRTSEPFVAVVIPGLPFHHRAFFIPNNSTQDESFFKDVEMAYVALVTGAFAAKPVGVVFGETSNQAVSVGKDEAGKSEVSYNVIFTRQWMIVIPRRQELFEGLSVNSVGFAGMLLAKTQDQVDQLQRGGVERVLAGVAYEPHVEESKF
ncbi:ATP adenylyltransferase-domain-containing protein [Obelidium mucronatum]|nr:ATP adenylyltransferase-domain-containing protein [Obelidium mucronatum]